MQKNRQEPERRILGVSDLLDVQEIFPTIQGEGPLTGRPAIFVRLAGCNLQCPLCDTDYTSARKSYSARDLLQKVGVLIPAVNSNLVVITGGEPFRQPISQFVKLAMEIGYSIQIETNGTLPPPDYFPQGTKIIISPKAGSVNDRTAYLATAFKYVMRSCDVDKSDGLPVAALGHPCAPRLARPPPHIPRDKIYLQPCDEGNADHNRRNLAACVASCMKFGYTLGIQLHKIIGVP